MVRRAVFALGLWLAGCSDDELGTAGGAGGAGGASGGGAGAGGVSSGGNGGAGNGSGTGGTVSGPPSLKRIGETLDVPSLAESAPKRFVDIAHHGTQDAYLVVTGSSSISATLIDGDGKQLAAPASLAQTTAWAQGPRVARGGGKFLVAWHDNRSDPNQPELRGRMISLNGKEPELGPSDFLIGPKPTRAEAPPGMAWSDTSKLFLVVWQAVPSTDLHARRVDASGAPVGSEIVLTSDPDWQSDPAVAWNPTNDEFLVVWAHADTTGATRARRVAAADGALLGPEIDLGSGTHIPAVEHEPGENRFVAAWWAGKVRARVIGPSGAPAGDGFDVAPGYGAYDGFAMARHPNLLTFAVVLHGSTDEDFAAAFASSGQGSAVIQATESPPSNGNFNPRVAANPLRNEWMMVTSRGFTTVAVQRLGP
ncbi:MAG: hypothetical protein HYZ29_18725 [Myxococcales bacterium]|nr:hypothetical protein [Myxococcales bacterium]